MGLQEEERRLQGIVRPSKAVRRQYQEQEALERKKGQFQEKVRRFQEKLRRLQEEEARRLQADAHLQATDMKKPTISADMFGMKFDVTKSRSCRFCYSSYCDEFCIGRDQHDHNKICLSSSSSCPSSVVTPELIVSEAMITKLLDKLYKGKLVDRAKEAAGPDNIERSPLVILDLPRNGSSALACILALFQSVKPLETMILNSGGIVADLMRELLNRQLSKENRIPYSEVLKYIDKEEGFDNSDLNLTLMLIDRTLHPIPSKTTNAESTEAVGKICFTFRVKVPKSFDPNKSNSFLFVFNVEGSTGQLGVYITPEAGTKPLDIISVNVNHPGALQPLKTHGLDDRISDLLKEEDTRVHPVVVPVQWGCQICEVDVSTTPIEAEMVSIRVPNVFSIKLETLLRNNFGPSSTPSRDLCRNCLHNSADNNMGGTWVWENSSKSWTMHDNDSFNSNCRVLQRKYIMSLPELLIINLDQFGWDRGARMRYTRVDFPLFGLSLDDCCLPSCIPPGERVLYDLRFISIYGTERTRSSTSPSPTKMDKYAALGETLPIPDDWWAIYYGFAKNTVDNKWYYSNNFDERSPCDADFLNTATRASLNNITHLCYIRRT